MIDPMRSETQPLLVPPPPPPRDKRLGGAIAGAVVVFFLGFVVAVIDYKVIRDGYGASATAMLLMTVWIVGIPLGAAIGARIAAPRHGPKRPPPRKDVGTS